jgi:hypothetical protein
MPKEKEEQEKSYKEQAFEFQMELLKVEIDLINQTIARFDEHTRATRNWAIVTWTGSIALVLGNADLRKYIILTAVLPALFWLIDARWTTLLRRFLYRLDNISEFLNGTGLSESFKQQRLVDFIVLDPRGKQYKGTKEFAKAVNLLRSALRYGKVSAFYFGLMIISIILRDPKGFGNP